MRQLGTDVVAVVCIVGGGVVAGGVTLALAARPELPSLTCATTVGTAPEVVVSLGGEGLVVVTPDVRLRAVKECVEHTVAEDSQSERTKRELERARREAERVQERVDRVRERVDRARRIDRVEHIHLEGLHDFDFRFEGLGEALEARLEALEGLEFEVEGLDGELRIEIGRRLDEEMRKIRERLERGGADGR